MKSKADLLNHYATREPKKFVQFDGFLESLPDDFIRPDVDGDACCRTATVELMQGAPVRVLIEPGTCRKDALRLLSKISDWLASEKREVVHWGESPAPPTAHLAELLLRAWQSGTLPAFHKISQPPPETLDDYDKEILSRIREEINAPF